MNRSLAIKSGVGMLLAAAAALALWLTVSGSSGAGTSSTPLVAGAANACASTKPATAIANPVRTVFGKTPNGAPEMTEYGADNTYEVTRCEADGTLIERQFVVAVQTPDGLRMLAAQIDTPTESFSKLLPSDYTASPELVALWKEQGPEALEDTLPPTSEPATTQTDE
jgi:hypothetical protein